MGFQCLDHPPYSPDLAPSDYHLFPGLKKNNWKFSIFRPTRRSLLPRRPGWTVYILIFFFLSGLRKLEQRAKECNELRGEYVEYIASLFAVVCFLPFRAKDLSALPRTDVKCETLKSPQFKNLFIYLNKWYLSLQKYLNRHWAPPSLSSEVSFPQE